MIGTDVQLAVAAQAGDERAADELVDRHASHFIAMIDRAGYWIAGADRDDVHAEVLMGIALAIRDYQPERGPFGAFAWLCARRCVLTAMKRGMKVGARPLNEALRVARLETHEVEAVELIAARDGDPVATLDRRETLRAFAAEIPRMTPMARDALTCWVNGCSYTETAEALGMEPGQASFKSVDNSLQRARRRLLRAAA